MSSEGGTKLLTVCCNLALVSPDKLVLAFDWSSFEDLETRWMFRRCFVRSPKNIKIEDNEHQIPAD